LLRWQRMGSDEAFWRKQTETVEAYVSMGIQPTCTCTPYLVGNTPGLGEHLAWSESSAVSYANSVLGARTNREGGPSALAAAIVGRTAAFGLHLEANRAPTLRVEVRCAVDSPSDFAALGYLVGREVKNGIPYFVGLEPGPLDALDDEGNDPHDKLKLLAAALAASGAVALYHVQGVTPEACMNPGLGSSEVPVLEVTSLDEAYAALNCGASAIDLVVIGCPHASLNELARVASALSGKELVSDFWVTTSRAVREQAQELGYVEDIERAGGALFADGCVVVAPMQGTGYKTLATNSAKMASYALPHAGLDMHFGTLEKCVAAAQTGYWES